MEYRKLGQTDLQVSVLSLGCNRLAAMVGDRREAEATILEALERGINLFDTADCYNQGDSERALGKLFQGRRDRVLICSKAGMTLGPLQGLRTKGIPFAKKFIKRWAVPRTVAASLAHQFNSQDFRPEYIERAISRSLRRLRTDYLDLFLLHNPGYIALSDSALFERLEKLRERGTVRHYGVSLRDSVTTEELDLSLARTSGMVMQVAIDPYHSAIIDELGKPAEKNGTGLIGRAPFAGGTLFQDKRIVNALSKSNPATAAQMALRLAMQLNPRGTILVGMDTRHHLRENLATLDLPPVSAECLAKLNLVRSKRMSSSI